jgi:hypothetical protein
MSSKILSFFTGGFYGMALGIGWRVFDTDCFTGSLCPYDLHSQNGQNPQAVREN